MKPHDDASRRVLLVCRALVIAAVAVLLAPASVTAVAAEPPSSAVAAETEAYVHTGRHDDRAAPTDATQPAVPAADRTVTVTVAGDPAGTTPWQPHLDDGRPPPGTRAPPDR
jgi:hypothetical protein